MGPAKGISERQRAAEGAIHAEHVGVVFLAIGAEKQRNDLRIVKVTLGEKRPQRAVGHPAGENLFFRGSAFALEEPPRETTRRGGLLLVFHRHGKPVLAFPHFCLRHRGDDHDCVSELHRDRTIGKFCDPAGLYLDFRRPDLGRY